MQMLYIEKYGYVGCIVHTQYCQLLVLKPENLFSYVICLYNYKTRMEFQSLWHKQVVPEGGKLSLLFDYQRWPKNTLRLAFLVRECAFL